MFNSDMTVVQWTDKLTNTKNQLINALNEAYDTWSQWNDLTYGMNVSSIMQISQFGGRTYSDVQKINTAFGTLKTIFDVTHGNTAVSSPYNFMGTLAPFE